MCFVTFSVFSCNFPSFRDALPEVINFACVDVVVVVVGHSSSNHVLPQKHRHDWLQQLISWSARVERCFEGESVVCHATTKNKLAHLICSIFGPQRSPLGSEKTPQFSLSPRDELHVSNFHLEAHFPAIASLGLGLGGSLLGITAARPWGQHGFGAIITV
jgi:hypothetical protein